MAVIYDRILIDNLTIYSRWKMDFDASCLRHCPASDFSSRTVFHRISARACKTPNSTRSIFHAVPSNGERERERKIPRSFLFSFFSFNNARSYAREIVIEFIAELSRQTADYYTTNYFILRGRMRFSNARWYARKILYHSG